MNSILVVDDEKPARKELRYLIESIVGMTDILEARSGHEALKLIQSNPIDIAFIDINLGDMDGITLAKEGKKITGNLKVIFSTAYDAYAVKAFEINAVDYIMKPFEQQRVEKALQRAQFPDSSADWPQETPSSLSAGWQKNLKNYPCGKAIGCSRLILMILFFWRWPTGTAVSVPSTKNSFLIKPLAIFRKSSKTIIFTG